MINHLSLNLASISILGLAIAITLSCTTKINVGILSLAMAWVIGTYLAGIPLAEIVAGFPSQLFLTLVGVTLLFTQAKVNGTLDRIAHRAVSLCQGHLGMIPIMFFVLALILGSIGPGSIASAALIAPMAMAVAGRTGIPVFLMALMVANGSSAASLSPFGSTGIIVNGLMAKMGLTGLEWRNYLTVLIAHSAVGFLGYLVFGGWRLFRASAADRAAAVEPLATVPNGDLPDAARRFARQHWWTVAVIAALMSSVVFFNVNVGMGALCGAVLLVLIGAADESASIRAMPWGPILMVSGVTVLVALVEKTGGMDLFSSLLAQFSSQRTITAFVALLTGTISIYSSTAGVVLPAFLPTVPGLVVKLGGGDPLAIAYSMIIGAHLVDVSPLSTTGALCIAAAPASADTRRLFRQMMAWGFSMAPIAALGCYLVYGLLWNR